MNDAKRIAALEEAVHVTLDIIGGLAERVAALEDGWETVGEAARQATKRLEGWKGTS